MSRRFTITCLLGLGCVLAACGSADKHVYHSTPWSPKTITIRDLLARKSIWEKNIPVNHRLVLDFDRSGDFPPFQISKDPATEMNWTLKQDGMDKPVAGGRFELQGVPILITMEIRKGPEYPPDYVSPTDEDEVAEVLDSPEPQNLATAGQFIIELQEKPVEDGSPAVPGSQSESSRHDGGQEDLLEEIRE